MKKVIKLTENDLIRIIKKVINEQEEDDSGVVVNVKDIAPEDMKCFSDVSAEDAKSVGLNHGGKYKVKHNKCKTTVKHKGPKIKTSGKSWP
jgi:hypothetical protein